MFLNRPKPGRRTTLVSAKRQRGVAIITALLVVTIAATISVTISTRLQLDVRRTGNLITIDQGYYYALFAEDYSLTLIKDQEKFDVLIENLREFGHFKQVFPVEGGTVDEAYLEEGAWEVDIAGNVFPARVSLKPMYDPGMKKVRA